MNLEIFSLKGKTAIVTGANTGLGQGMAVALAEAGANIVGVARREMSETEELVKAAGAEFLPVIADLLTLEPIDRIIEEATARFGEIDILVNNAGIIRREDAIDFSEEDWDDVINTNLKTLYFLSQKAARQFIKQGHGGKIINIASMLSYQGGIRVPAYTASKHAVMGVTKSMANEWAKYGINVNAIAPGYMVTNNTENLRKDPVRYNEILGRIPAGRWGMPADMGGTAVYLASKASDYVHGFTVAVDGGWLSR
ncbi:MAG: 2-dehydro-3-deoxy-D-gluconate 5-dehydrogenase KduD [Ruminococcaceae bacterium]|nr:2-dehydro-3-deoxy-D-gluconate 5-dehydrogenase KduD [Oscillospiraceae bacterium]